MFIKIKNGEKRLSRDSLPPPPPPPQNPKSEDKLALPSLRIAKQYDALSRQCAKSQKEYRSGSLSFRFLRSRSKSTSKVAKVFPTTNQNKLNPISAFQSAPVDLATNKKTEGLRRVEKNIEGIEASKQLHIATVTRRRFSSSFCDELIKDKPSDDALPVGFNAKCVCTCV